MRILFMLCADAQGQWLPLGPFEDVFDDFTFGPRYRYMEPVTLKPLEITGPKLNVVLREVAVKGACT